MPDRAETRKQLNRVLIVAIADGLLLLVLLYFSQIDRNEDLIPPLGATHGIGFLLLLFLTAKGAGEERWGWWFPAITLVTGGPLGSIIGDLKLRRDLKA